MGLRTWIDLNQSISDKIVVKKLAAYEAPWTYLLNGSNVKEETGLKFDDCIIFESARKVSSLEEACEMLITRIKEYHLKIFGIDGIYLIHLKVEPQSDDVIRGEKLAYAPFFIVQALVDVQLKH